MPPGLVIPNGHRPKDKESASPTTPRVEKGKGRQEEKVIPSPSFSIADSDEEDEAAASGKHMGAVVDEVEGEERLGTSPTDRFVRGFWRSWESADEHAIGPSPG